MAKYLFALCLTILIANVVVAESNDVEEILNQEVNAFLSYPKSLISKDILFDVYSDIELDEESGKCIRPLRRCDKGGDLRCCRHLRCGRIIKRCLPAWLVPKPPETTTES
ncbi:uncharacterized protein LOC127277176 [Leptopilina boulardi]|uniref:uncharacterized protein LOC127277176 n=1 Tax=Leptopilina boulardi TaxID=63433 RepID=UPI0021F63A6D|nr:uncharacterized protein LOC127277176 [Leptopilina boulardi]